MMRKSGRRRDRAQRVIPYVPDPVRVFDYYRRPVLSVIEDRRTFHPLREARPVATLSRRDQRRLVERPINRPVRDKDRPLSYVDPFPALRLGFAVPEKVVRCVRRKQRREVLFAVRKTGAGSRARYRRRDEWSDVSC